MFPGERVGQVPIETGLARIEGDQNILSKGRVFSPGYETAKRWSRNFFLHHFNKEFEGTTSYAGLLLATAESFGHCSRLFCPLGTKNIIFIQFWL